MNIHGANSKTVTVLQVNYSITKTTPKNIKALVKLQNTYFR